MQYAAIILSANNQVEVSSLSSTFSLPSTNVQSLGFHATVFSLGTKGENGSPSDLSVRCMDVAKPLSISLIVHIDKHNGTVC